jgi:seryl-tRNA synthetase
MKFDPPRERRQAMNDNVPAADFPKSWLAMLNEMQREWDRMHQEIAQLRAERDQLSKALIALLREDDTLCEEEIFAQIGHEKPLRDFLQEMRAQLGEDRSNGAI